MAVTLSAASTFMGAVFSSMGTPKFIADALLSWNLPPFVFIMGILFVACFSSSGGPWNGFRSWCIVVPIFLPVLQGLHTDMIWFSDRSGRYAADLLALATGGPVGLLSEGDHAGVGTEGYLSWG